MARILYISYDGLTEPLGYSQVYKYLRNLSALHQIFILTFEKKSAPEYTQLHDKLRSEMGKCPLKWLTLSYHKKPAILSTLYDVMIGLFYTLVQIKRQKVGFLHCRSYVACLIGWIAFKLTGTPYIFDMRGFWADEKIESCSWKKGGLIDRLVRKLERYFILDAAKIVTLTRVAKNELISTYCELTSPSLIKVIPTCTDTERFHVNGNERPESSPPTLGYIGSIKRYDFDSLLKCFEIWLELTSAQNGRIIILNQGEHAEIRAALKKNSLLNSRVEIFSCRPDEIHNKISQLSASVFLTHKSRAILGMAPTKLAELLASGVPCLTNEGLGDSPEILKHYEVGIVVTNNQISSLREGVSSLLALSKTTGIRERCASVASSLFSLERGAEAYHQIYLEMHSKAQNHRFPIRTPITS